MKKIPLNVLLKFFPKELLIIPAVALVLKVLAPGLDVVWDCLINLSFTFLFIILGIVIHEAGHLLAGMLAGGEPRRMILGIGHEIYRTEVAGVKVVLNLSPRGGMAMVKFENEKFIRARYAFYILGGVLVNLLVAAAVFFITGFDKEYFAGLHGVDLASAFIFANASKVINLIPFKSSAFGMPAYSDGLLLIKSVFEKKGAYADLQLKSKFFDGYDYLQNREYEKARDVFKQVYEKYPDEPTSITNLALAHIKLGSIDEAFALMQPLESKLNTKELKRYRGLIHNNIAWLYLLKGDINAAWENASWAVRDLPKANFVRGTYGAVLVERGDLTEGIHWLNQNVDMNHPNVITLTASTSLMLAYHLTGDFKRRDHHLNFVLNNLDKLDKDDLILVKRNMTRMNMSLPPIKGND